MVGVTQQVNNIGVGRGNWIWELRDALAAHVEHSYLTFLWLLDERGTLHSLFGQKPHTLKEGL